MRPRGSRQTASSCSCSRRPSRRAWLSLCLRTRCACTTPRSSPCRTCSRGLTTRPRSPASRPWRRPASEPVCYSLRDPRPGPSQGVSRPPRARTLHVPQSPTRHPARRGGSGNVSCGAEVVLMEHPLGARPCAGLSCLLNLLDNNHTKQVVLPSCYR